MTRILMMTVFLWMLAMNSFADQAYMEKFNAYVSWRDHLPEEPSQDFLSFIDSETPLAKKLREKWLYQLAKEKNWTLYVQHYRASEDVSLQCYAQLAKYDQGKTQEALNAAKSLWLVGNTQPEACDDLFKILLSSDKFDENLITERIVLALNKRNLQLARFLLKQYKTPHTQDMELLIGIYRKPVDINKLSTGELHDDFYLYGLKRMVSFNMDKAIAFWRHVKTKKLLSEAQQQAFLAHVALYKAMRAQDDAYEWFHKVKSPFYSDVLLDWQIRYALKKKKWHRVQKLIELSDDKDSPCWQYWLARSLEAQGQRENADVIYQNLSKMRHYYGFLASMKLKKPFHFENEKPVSNLDVLLPYSAFLQEVKSLYQSGHTLQASRNLNDFMSELPKDEASALAYWVATELDWHGKSVYLSNSNEELNDQLALRFPLSHREIVNNYAKNYEISPAFVYAIIRQESAFRSEVVSRVGARGLMQLMPKTAQMVAKKEKISLSNHNQLFRSDTNIKIGVAYLKELSKRFNHDLVLMAAAYNAGPRQVNYWLKNHQADSIDIWIETLPWHETRNYLKNVIAFYLVYQYQMHKKPDLKGIIN